jgi:hypothetical protein
MSWVEVVGRSPLVTGWQAYKFAERLTTIGQGLCRKGQAGGNIPVGCFLSNGFSRSREAQAFPSVPSGLVFFANLAESFAQRTQRKTSPRRHNQGMPED